MADKPPQELGPFGRAIRDPITYFTFLLVVVGGLQWRVLDKTDGTLRLQQRAWILPAGVNLIRAPEADRGILFVVLSTNTGREPALHASLSIQNNSIDSYDTKDADLANIEVPENTSCYINSRSDTLIPPSSEVATTTNSDEGEPRYVADSKIVAKQRFFVVQGCWKYVTLEEQKLTKFCFIMQPTSDSETVAIPSIPVVGPIGGSPNTPPPTPALHLNTAKPPKEGFVFVPCRSGFDAT